MSRAALVFAIVAAGAGCGRSRRAAPAPPRLADAGPAPVDATPAPAPAEHAFVVGSVVVAARQDGLVRPLRLDPATGAWTALGSGDAHLFPTEAADGDALLVVTARGEHDGDHVEQLAWVRGAAVAPLGPTAASIRNPTRAGAAIVFESSERSFRDLYRLDRAGAAVRLTDDRAGNFEPMLAPDGAAVVFTSSRDGDAELYRMPTAGGRATRLTASARDDWGARWSPDGRRLAFLSDREGPPRAFVMAADGTDLHRLTAETDPALTEDAPRWSPDGATIALLRSQPGASTAALIDVATRAARLVTPAGAADGELAWSPDGAYLVIARRTPPSSPPTVTFVRISDSTVVATDRLEPLALRWFRTPRSRGD